MAHKRTRTDLNSAAAFRIADAAAAYSIGISTLHAAIRNGELKASKLGTRPRSPLVITRTAIEKWLERCRIKPSAQ